MIKGFSTLIPCDNTAQATPTEMINDVVIALIASRDAISGNPRFELAAPAPLNLVCFRLKAGDDANRRLLEQLNQSGELYLTHTVLDGKFTLRLVVGQTWTEAQHVERAWQRIREMASIVQ